MAICDNELQRRRRKNFRRRILLEATEETGDVAGDVYYNDISLLVSGSGTNGGTDAVDLSRHGHTLTYNGNAQVSNAQSKFQDTSVLFDGTGDNITTTTSSTAFRFEQGDFTIECWFYLNDNTDVHLFSWAGDTGKVYVDSNSKITLYNGSVALVGDNALSTGQWYHLKLERYKLQGMIWIDGATERAAGPVTFNTNYSTGNTFIIGDSVGTNPMNGYIEDIRVTRDVSRTRDLTLATVDVPTAAYSQAILTFASPTVPQQASMGVWLEAQNATSYPGTGDVWFDLSGNDNDATFGTADDPPLMHVSGDGGYFDLSEGLGSSPNLGWTIPDDATISISVPTGDHTYAVLFKPQSFLGNQYMGAKGNPFAHLWGYYNAGRFSPYYNGPGYIACFDHLMCNTSTAADSWFLFIVNCDYTGDARIRGVCNGIFNKPVQNAIFLYSTAGNAWTPVTGNAGNIDYAGVWLWKDKSLTDEEMFQFTKYIEQTYTLSDKFQDL